jgi:hypothetical protein
MRDDFDLPSFEVSPAEPEDDSESASEGGEAPNGATEIYVSVGRRDGAKPSDYQTALESAGIDAETTQYVRVRHRHTFVGVREEDLDRVVAALNGAMIAGRRASAERARRG